MIYFHEAIYALNPSVKTIRGDIAYDANEQEVHYDLAQVEAKLNEMQTAKLAAEQTVKNTRASALAKLANFGLTQDEVKSLVGE